MSCEDILRSWGGGRGAWGDVLAAGDLGLLETALPGRASPQRV